MARKWNQVNGNWEVAVIELPSGNWLGHMGLRQNLDRFGSSHKQEVFQDVEAALMFVGFPVDLVPIPEELR